MRDRELHTNSVGTLRWVAASPHPGTFADMTAPEVVRREGKLELRRNPETGEHHVVAAERISPGETVWTLTPRYSNHRDRYSIQVSENVHQVYTGEMDDYIEHSCIPNLAFNPKTETFTAIRVISAGEEVFWNYLTTEWELENPFVCRDRREDRGPCHGIITGAKDVVGYDAVELAEIAAPWIRRQLRESPDWPERAQ